MEEERYYKRNIDQILVEQGDIFSNLKMEEYRSTSNGIEKSEIIWDKVMVISQSCDLHREQENDDVSNEILSVLVVPIFNLMDFQQGTHLKKIDKEKEEIGKKMLERIALMNRYQILRLSEEERSRFKLEDSIIDFRYYFTVPIKKFNKENYEFSLYPIYIDKITQSFASYISRIPLPIELDKIPKSY